MVCCVLQLLLLRRRRKNRSDDWSMNSRMNHKLNFILVLRRSVARSFRTCCCCVSRSCCSRSRALTLLLLRLIQRTKIQSWRFVIIILFIFINIVIVIILLRQNSTIMNLFREILRDSLSRNHALNRAKSENGSFTSDSSTFETAEIHDHMCCHRDRARRTNVGKKFPETDRIENAVGSLLEIESVDEQIPFAPIEADRADSLVVPAIDVVLREDELAARGNVVRLELVQGIAPKIIVQQK